MAGWTLKQLDREMLNAMDSGYWELASKLGDKADEITKTPPQDLLTAALHYAHLGLKVFPLQPGKKIPYPGSRGCKDATSDTDQLYSWWTKAPQSNLGIATGHLVDVIDIDGLKGILSTGDLTDMPPVMGVAKTVRPGGWHKYVAATGAGNRAGMLPGIDYRGVGGYVVAPPSRIGDSHYYWTTQLELDA